MCWLLNEPMKTETGYNYNMRKIEMHPSSTVLGAYGITSKFTTLTNIMEINQ